MKSILTIFIFLSLSFSNAIKKSVLNYGIAIVKADLIVEGQVSKISKDNYEFKIKDWVKGKSSDKVSVNIWKEWTCDERIEEHKIGQKLVLILSKADGIGYNIINDSTGELFIQDDNSIKTFYEPNLSSNISDLKDGIKMFLKAYDFKGSAYYNLKNKEERYFVRLIEQNEIDKMIVKNSFFEWMAKNLKYYDIK